MATAIGFQFSTAKVIKENQYPTIVDSDHCFNPNKKLFGVLVGLGCGLVTAIIFHFILLKQLMNAKSEFKLSLSFITKKFKKNEQTNEIPAYVSNMEIITTKVGPNGNGHANGHVKDHHNTR